MTIECIIWHIYIYFNSSSVSSKSEMEQHAHDGMAIFFIQSLIQAHSSHADDKINMYLYWIKRAL